MVDQVPYNQLLLHRKKLGRMCKADKDRAWQKIDKAAVLGVIALLFGGAAIGGAVALIPFFASDPDHRTKMEYFVVVGVTAAFALLAAFGRMAVKAEQMTSLTDLHDEFGGIVDDYKEAMAAAAAETPKPSVTL